MRKEILNGLCIITIVFFTSNRIGRDFWNAKIICNKINIDNNY